MRAVTQIVLGLTLGLTLICPALALAQDAAPPPPPPPTYVEPPAMTWGHRVAFLYSPEISLSNSSLGDALSGAVQGAGLHNFGIDYSLPTSWISRYHLQVDYTYGYGLSALRIEPLGYGWAIPLIHTPRFKLEIEPLISLVDGIFFFSKDSADNGNLTFILGTGAEVQLNVVTGPFYFFASPVGLELRYLSVTTGADGSVTGGLDPLFRFRIGLGVEY